MKRSLLPVMALGASLFTATLAVGQTAPASGSAATPAANAPAQPPQKQMKLVKMATLEGAQVNREFQNNVQVVQGQRQAAVQLKDQIDKEKDAKKKAELQTQFDTLIAKLNENNELMKKTYGFSIGRDYIMEIEKSNIYMLVTEEEAAKIEEAAKAEAAKAGSTPAAAPTTGSSGSTKIELPKGKK